MDEFVIGVTQPNRTPTFCWVCRTPITVNELVAICRWADKRWERAHPTCADKHPDNAANQADNYDEYLTKKVNAPLVDLYTLEPGRYQRRDKYVVKVDNRVVYQTGQLAQARGVVQLLEENPDIASNLAQKYKENEG